MKKPIVRKAKNQPKPAVRLSTKLKAGKAEPPAPRQIGKEDRRKGIKIMTALHATLDSEFATRFDNAIRDNVRVKFIGQTKGRGDELRYNYTSTESDQHTQMPVHNQAVAKLQPELSWRNSRIAMTCSCNDFTYRAEFAWMQRGAALEPMKSNGEPAHKTNPRNIPFACKHAIVIFNRLLKSNR